MTEKTFPTFIFEAKNLREQLKVITPFMSDDETRYYLNGVYFKYDGKQLKAVATNGHILYEAVMKCAIEHGEAFAAICPRQAIAALCSMLKECAFGRVTMTVEEAKPYRLTFDNTALSGTSCT
ncbi:DNA polymerase III subunit beta family protein [Tautonia plasticadhaerens]|uniref:Beta sliding clamp n=1 Tax=Tautonia plasticadhaerens TaxID=2527974 RepID=A0A518H2C3_9BACT|nr:hypothetical protein [Tautonia plasticadhaerens]QDV34984.1 DNA polymerase III subunit beta [Tautonia plasticadhaerens]